MSNLDQEPNQFLLDGGANKQTDIAWQEVGLLCPLKILPYSEFNLIAEVSMLPCFEPKKYNKK